MSNNVQNLKIYDIIEQLEDLIENSPRPKLGGSATKRTVDIEEVFDLLGDLKTTIPEDIRRANSMMIEAQNTIDNAAETARDTIETAENQANGIVAEAQNKADLVLQKAREEYERLIAEDEIYQEAQKRAQLLATKAEYNANEVFENAKTYADDILADLERFLGEYKNLVNVNRKDLGARARVSQVIQPPVIQPQQVVQPQQPVVMQQPVMAEPVRQPAQPMREERNSVRDNAARGRRQAAPVAVNDDDDDFYDDEEDRGGFLFGLFKKKKGVDDDDFDDDFDE